MSIAPLHIVTGGAGFIGSNIAAALCRRNADVVVVDWLGNGDKWRNLANLRLVDIVPPPQAFTTLETLAGRVASVIHMGAISSTTTTDVDAILENNFHVSCRLWDWCARFDVPFIYASSAATYGDGSLGFDDDDSRSALARLRPLNAYAWSKYLFDRWAVDRANGNGLAPARWAGLKFFNVYGPNEFHKQEQRSVALQLFEQIGRGEPVKLFASDRPDYADGGQKRDFVWVGDCVDVVLWFAEAARPNGIYNVGSGIAPSFADLAHSVFRAMDRQPDIRYVPMPAALKGKYQYFTRANIGKLERAGYGKAPTSLEDGVQQYVQFLMNSRTDHNG